LTLSFDNKLLSSDKIFPVDEKILSEATSVAGIGR
jgi:hypothetical protein